MTNGKLFREIAKTNHRTLQELAEAIGISRQGLFKKIENHTEFKASEITKLSDLLGLSEQKKQNVFFAL